MLLLADTEPVDVILTFVPLAAILVVALLALRWSRRASGFIGGDRRGRLPAVINPTGGVPETAVITSQPVPAYEAVYHAGSKDHPPFLTVTAFLPTALDFMASRREEQRQHSLLFRASTNRALSGDEAFDRQFEVASVGASVLLAAMLKAPAVREPLEALFALGFNIIRSDGKGLDATWYNYPHGGQVDAGLLASAVQHFQRLSEAIRQAVPEPEPIVTLSTSMRTTLLAVIPILIAVPLSMFWTEAAPLRPPLYLPVLRVAAGLPPMLLLGAILYVIIRQRSQSSYGRLMVIIASLISSYFFGDFAFRLLNSRLDREPATVTVSRVVGWGERGGNNYVEVVPWDSATSSMRVPVSFSDCERVKMHDANEWGYLRIEVITRPGVFGYGWVESYRLLPPADGDSG